MRASVTAWLETVVVGLNLCPFAGLPFREGRVRIHVSAADSELELLADLQLELARLSETAAAVLETTIIAIPNLLADFADYNDFLDQVDALLDAYEWTGEVQVASFHPDYQFAGTAASDAENCTNRAPLPLLHLLREDSVEAAIANHPDVAAIPEANIARMNALTLAQRQALFVRLTEPAVPPQAPHR